jgi:uncharacterized protein YjdB
MSLAFTFCPGTVSVGKTLALTAVDALRAPPAPAVTYESDNTTVATVDASGVVTGVAAGHANITARSGGQAATCGVSVTN